MKKRSSRWVLATLTPAVRSRARILIGGRAVLDERSARKVPAQKRRSSNHFVGGSDLVHDKRPAQTRRGTHGSERTVNILGSPGSTAAPGPHTVYFGGNTSCVNLVVPDHILIFDAGSGICMLGQSLSDRGEDRPVTGSISLSHMCWDHIQGLPFFAPLRVPSHRFTIYGEGKEGQDLPEALSQQMPLAFRRPYEDQPWATTALWPPS
jgi:hypothetical protein